MASAAMLLFLGFETPRTLGGAVPPLSDPHQQAAGAGFMLSYLLLGVCGGKRLMTFLCLLDCLACIMRWHT